MCFTYRSCLSQLDYDFLHHLPNETAIRSHKTHNKTIFLFETTFDRLAFRKHSTYNKYNMYMYATATHRDHQISVEQNNLISNDFSIAKAHQTQRKRSNIARRYNTIKDTHLLYYRETILRLGQEKR